jgi:long-chain acyl-CoA synthetase
MPSAWTGVLPPEAANLPDIETLHARALAAPFPPNMPALLAERAAEHPDRMAAVFFAEPDGTALRHQTYGQLQANVARMASALHKLGVKRGDVVGIMLPNRPEYPITWLAATSLGAVTTAINVRYTAREMAYVLKDSGASWLVLGADLTPMLPELGDVRLPAERTIVVGAAVDGFRDWHALLAGGDPAFRAPVPPSLEDRATIQYTSGTTGFPKGVVLTHRYWLTFARIGVLEPAYLNIERVFFAQPFFYMAGQAVFLFGLTMGATVSIAPQLSLKRFMPWVRETRAQYTLATNAILKQDLPPEDGVNDLKFIHVSAAYAPETHAAIERRFGAPVRNIYGMTENGIAIYVPLNAPQAIGPTGVGVVAPFREVMIAGPDGKSVPEGEIGEICVRGPGIIVEYHNKPEANRETFFGEWHRSGDQGRRDAQGFYHFLGRSKDVIRRNNENISALEVESVLLSLPGIGRAGVVAVPDDMKGEEVKAYLVLNGNLTKDDLPPEAVIAHCRKYLAAFKVPRYLEYRTSVPTTASDKIEKHGLLKEKPDLRSGAWDREAGAWR